MINGTIPQVLAGLEKMGWIRYPGYNPSPSVEVIDSPKRAGAQWAETFGITASASGVMATRGERDQGKFLSYNNSVLLESVLPTYGQTAVQLQAIINGMTPPVPPPVPPVPPVPPAPDPDKPEDPALADIPMAYLVTGGVATVLLAYFLYTRRAPSAPRQPSPRPATQRNATGRRPALLGR